MGSIMLGVVEAINRFPVKSMHAEPLVDAPIGWTGVLGDRRYGFVRSTNNSRFPWLTGREVADLVLHRPRFDDAADPRTSAVSVMAPDGEVFAIDDPALTKRLSAVAGEPVHLMHLGRGCYDSMPISVVATATLDRLEAAHGQPLGLDRFRINVVVRTLPDAGRETEWLGGVLHFGNRSDSAAIRLAQGIQRCSMVTIDPISAVRDPSVLRLVARSFDNEIGAYGTAVTLGRIRVGDPVYLHRGSRSA